MKLAVKDNLYLFSQMKVVSFIAECLSARYLILQYSLAVCCMYVSHALECNYSWGDFRYIIDDR